MLFTALFWLLYAADCCVLDSNTDLSSELNGFGKVYPSLGVASSRRQLHIGATRDGEDARHQQGGSVAAVNQTVLSKTEGAPWEERKETLDSCSAAPLSLVSKPISCRFEKSVHEIASLSSRSCLALSPEMLDEAEISPDHNDVPSPKSLSETLRAEMLTVGITLDEYRALEKVPHACEGISENDTAGIKQKIELLKAGADIVKNVKDVRYRHLFEAWLGRNCRLSEDLSRRIDCYKPELTKYYDGGSGTLWVIKIQCYSEEIHIYTRNHYSGQDSGQVQAINQYYLHLILNFITDKLHVTAPALMVVAEKGKESEALVAAQEALRKILEKEEADEIEEAKIGLDQARVCLMQQQKEQEEKAAKKKEDQSRLRAEQEAELERERERQEQILRKRKAEQYAQLCAAMRKMPVEGVAAREAIRLIWKNLVLACQAEEEAERRVYPEAAREEGSRSPSLSRLSMDPPTVARARFWSSRRNPLTVPRNRAGSHEFDGSFGAFLSLSKRSEEKSSSPQNHSEDKLDDNALLQVFFAYQHLKLICCMYQTVFTYYQLLLINFLNDSQNHLVSLKVSQFRFCLDQPSKTLPDPSPESKAGKHALKDAEKDKLLMELSIRDFHKGRSLPESDPGKNDEDDEELHLPWGLGALHPQWPQTDKTDSGRAKTSWPSVSCTSESFAVFPYHSARRLLGSSCGWASRMLFYNPQFLLRQLYYDLSLRHLYSQRAMLPVISMPTNWGVTHSPTFASQTPITPFWYEPDFLEQTCQEGRSESNIFSAAGVKTRKWPSYRLPPRLTGAALFAAYMLWQSTE